VPFTSDVAKNRSLRRSPKLVKTSSTRTLRAWASAMICRPIGPTIR